MTRLPRALATLAAALLAASALTACVGEERPSGEQFPEVPEGTLFDVLGVEVPTEAADFEGALADRMAESSAWSAEFAEIADADAAAELQRWGGPSDGEGAPDAAGASIQVVGTVAAMPTGGGAPGIDIPIVSNETRTTTSEAGGMPVTTTQTGSSRTENQVVTTTISTTTTAGDPQNPTATETATSTSAATVCPEEGEVSGDWSVERTQTVRAGGQTVQTTMSLGGQFKRNKHGTIDLRGVRFTATTMVTPDGGTPTTSTAEATLEVYAWDTSKKIEEAVGRFDASGDEAARQQAIDASILMLTLMQNVPKEAATNAQSDREFSGLCARIQVDTHGQHKLGDGQSATFDAWVIDPKTGEELGEAALEAFGVDGTVTPRNATGRTSFTFTAEGDPIYRLTLTATTPRGGHGIQLHYGAMGWKFEGIVDSYTIPTHLGPIPASSTWSGQVCGDVWNEWDVTITVRGEGVEHTLQLPMKPEELSATSGIEQVTLIYEVVPNPGPDELPFRLWADEIQSERVPSHSRIQILPEPLDTCIE